jgi:hypothetical protein
MRILPIAFALATFGWSASLKDQLSLFATLSPTDTVTALHTRTGTLDATVLDRKTGAMRTVSTPLNEVARGKILDQAKAEKVPVDDSASAPPETLTTDAANAKALGDQYRRGYFWASLGPSVLLYEFGIPATLSNAFSPQVVVGLDLLAVPAICLGSSVFASGREWNQGNIFGVSDATGTALWGSAALGAIAGGADFEAFQIAFGAAMLSYPFATYIGYGNGSAYADNPGRLSMRTNIGSDLAIAAIAAPLVLLDHIPNPDGFARMEGVLALAGYAGGHFLANTWKRGEHVPLGNPAGISQWGLMGAAAGVELAAVADVNGLHANIALPLGGYVAGLGAGWFAFQSRQDDEDRAFYDGLGAGGGYLAGEGLWYLAGMPLSRRALTSYLVGGSIAGYLVTSVFTSNMREDSRSRKTWIHLVSLDPLPVLALSTRPDGSSERVWQVPGLQVRFR